MIMLYATKSYLCDVYYIIKLYWVVSPNIGARLVLRTVQSLSSELSIEPSLQDWSYLMRICFIKCKHLITYSKLVGLNRKSQLCLHKDV